MAGDSLQAVFDPILVEINAEMRAVRREQVEIAPMLWEIIDYHFGWNLGVDDIQQLTHVSGKKIRPLLMALVAQAVCGQYRHVLPAGAALELIHNFTLIHDDVMDESTERRHRPTVWTRWGSAQAVNAGDGMYALANLAVTRLGNHGTPPHKIVRTGQILSQACLWTAEGQILDMDFEGRASVTPDEYITMITHKTGTLIEAAALIGALLSTDDESAIQGYGQFARSLGVAFQVRDDYLDVWGDASQVGKMPTDIREKKKSYPVLVAFARADSADRAVLQRIYAQPALSDADVAAVVGILNRAGAAEQTDEVAGRFYRAALDALDRTGIHAPTQDVIRQLAAFLIQRAY